ncbi:MAG: hypothetical protein IT454_03530 [Planctomycetes bacterium]|nr:hypothetical protein [Planctomycetota bacterium]
MQRPSLSHPAVRSSLSTAILMLFGCAASAPASQAGATPSATPEPARTPQATVQLALPPEHVYAREFFPGTSYDASISTPDELLGFRLGHQPAHHAQVLDCWRTWARQSKRVKLETYGWTHEGRELVCGIVASAANLERLDAILERIGKLADPRQLAAGEAQGLIRDTPALAWLGYSIHGDEMSGVDGGLALAHHLIAGTSSDVTQILERVVVVIDPMQNPDGRERFLSMLLQSAGATAVLDGEALSHGRWPGGRGNHYLFDMNRDWIGGIAPETRGRWKVVQRFHPQLFVDAHEMGRDDSYLFYPQADPINPHLPQRLVAWQQRYAADIARAFDAYGWSYYTREWADGWGPFYSDSWGSLNGAIGILYEQARYNGQTVKLQSGEIATYREAAHHQAVASLANITTLANNREEVLRDYARQRALDTFGVDDPSLAGRTPAQPPFERPIFVLRPGANATRAAWLWTTLREQGIEIETADGAKLDDVVSSWGNASATLELEGALWIVRGLQPQGAMARAFLEFDTRYPRAELERERKSLETKGDSKIYDTTAWNFAHALGLEAWRCAAVSATRAAQAPQPRQGVVVAPPEPAAHVYGWIVDGVDDGSVEFAARAMQLGLKLNVADEPFESAGRKFARGSILVRGHENGPDAAQLVARAAQAAAVTACATNSARAPGVGHDLGGQHFLLLETPRVALLSNAPVSNQAFGHMWHFLDRELGLPVSLLDAQELSSYDLRRYNVIVIPPAGALGAVLDPAADALRAWVHSGGTLIAAGSSATALCAPDGGLSSVRERGDVLDKLEEYLFAGRREMRAGSSAIDVGAVWDGVSATPTATEAAPPAKSEQAPARDSDPDVQREERWRRRFAPQGVFLRAHVRTDHWLTAGADDQLPVFFDGAQSLWSRSPASTVVRCAAAPEVRLSGLLWPEARERLAESAYLTVERSGHGQVILFAAQPGFRGFHWATARLFANAVVIGPGAGTNPPRAR